MSPRQLPLLVALLVGAALVPSTSAQPAAPDMPLCLERLTADDRLSQGNVNDLRPDRQGFLWLATEAGLDRYGGYGFRVHRPTPFEATLLADEAVRTLSEDPDVRLWVGASDGPLWMGSSAGLQRLNSMDDGGRFTPAPAALHSLGDACVGALHEDAPGSGAAFVVCLSALPYPITTTATPLASSVPPEP